MASNLRYIGTMDTGKSNLNSRVEFKLDHSGKAFLDFDQSNLNAGKVGIKGFKPHDKLSTSLWFQPSAQKGNLEMVADVGYDTTVTVSPNYPLPQDIKQVPVKLVTKKNIKAIDWKLTAHPLSKEVNVLAIKDLSHMKHFEKASVMIDHPKDTVSLRLQSKQYDFQNMKHDFRLTSLMPFGSSDVAQKNTLLYTGEVNSELKIKAEMCQPKAKDTHAKVSAVYKLGDVEATATADLNSEMKLVNSNLMLKTTLDM